MLVGFFLLGVLGGFGSCDCFFFFFFPLKAGGNPPPSPVQTLQNRLTLWCRSCALQCTWRVPYVVPYFSARVPAHWSAHSMTLGSLPSASNATSSKNCGMWETGCAQNTNTINFSNHSNLFLNRKCKQGETVSSFHQEKKPSQHGPSLIFALHNHPRPLSSF